MKIVVTGFSGENANDLVGVRAYTLIMYSICSGVSLFFMTESSFSILRIYLEGHKIILAYLVCGANLSDNFAGVEGDKIWILVTLAVLELVGLTHREIIGA